jgi:hypothetical protein
VKWQGEIMPTLYGRAPQNSYQELLKLNNTGAGVQSTLLAVQDGTGVNTPLQLSTTQIALSGALWPTSVGTTGQFLTASNSSGSLAWSSLSSSNVTTALGYTPANTATVASTYAPLASPALTGTPTAPTAGSSTNTTQVATTAFVQNAVSAVTGGLNFIGTWNAATNTPTITSSVGTKGQLYKVATAGTTTVNGVSSWNVGDMLVFDGTNWDKIDGQATEVISFNTRTGAITLSSSDVSTALGYTPANVASPTFTGTVTIPAGAAISGYATTASPTITGRTQSDAYSYTVVPLTVTSGATTINMSAGSEFTVTITGNTTISFSNPPTGNQSQVVYVQMTNGGTGTITWPTGTLFAAGTPPTYTVSGLDLFGIKYDASTATYMVFIIGQALAT